LLSERDLALPKEVEGPEDAEVFETDSERDADEVFPQSVASGGPASDGVVLWTRVNPELYADDQPLGVEVASDPDFEDEVYRGVVTNSEAIRRHDYTVKIDLQGTLEPDRFYYYRFFYSGCRSRTGRCRTLPSPDSSPDEVSFAVVTCQNYLNGYYGAYHHISEEDIDFVVHVGDFIYESSAGDFKGLGSDEFEDREIELPSGNERVHTLEDYRYLYRTYRSDPLLQEAFERHTVIPARDDHEIANDVYWDYEEGGPKAKHPRGDDTDFMTRLTADAMHAWWEYMPTRVEYDPDSEGLQNRFRLWRSMEFGDLVDLIMTDERLFRHPPRETLLPTRSDVAPEKEDEDRTMLGDAQRDWFVDEVRSSEATWTVWSDEVLPAPLRVGVGPLSVYPVRSGWDSYTRERREIFEEFADSDVSNLVTLTGDMHCYIAGYLRLEREGRLSHLFRNGDREDTGEEKTDLGVVFMTPALTSLNIAEAVGVDDGLLSGPTERFLSWSVKRMNPHIEFFNSHRNGYSVVEFTRESCTYTAYEVDKTENSRDAQKSVVKRFRVPEGEVELEDVTHEEDVVDA
ncbi:MAG: alkaline phosphatase D family protein, partial [Halobacteria archaeon]|nr:alkaline phosphatase D family protein [Halobacteria archaeon]